jgi:hypothetical protein
MSRRIAVMLLFLLLGAWIRSADAPLTRPGREIALSPDEVKDTFFAYVIGVIISGVEVDLTNSDLRDILTEFKTSLDLPFDLITAVRQTYDPESGQRSLSIDFNSSVDIPIPFSFLGYHPGVILASQSLHLSEMNPASSDPTQPSSAVFVLRLIEGGITVDVDDWIEFLLPIVDDLFVRMLVIFKYEDTWYCMLEGIGKRGEEIMEFFNFTRNLIVFPVPSSFTALGKRFIGSDSSIY